MRWILEITAITALLLLAGCKCFDPGSQEIGGELCPSGHLPAANLSIGGDFSQLRPVGLSKEVRVTGTRKDADPCFTGNVGFTVDLMGEGRIDAVSPPPLAHGSWELTVIPVTELPEEKVTVVLEPEGDHLLTIAGTATGDLDVTLNP